MSQGWGSNRWGATEFAAPPSEVPILIGVTSSTSTLVGAITAPAFLSGVMSSNSIFAGVLTGKALLTGLTASTSSLIGSITVPQPPPPPVPGLLPSTSYYTAQVYETLPQSLQEQDAANGYTLWWFIEALVSGLDALSVLYFDSIGGGSTVFPVDSAPISYSPAMLKSNISNTATSFTVFNTNPTWNQINTSLPFPLEIEGERMLIPPGFYDWTATEVTFIGVTRGWDRTAQVAHMASSGATGEFDLTNYLGAPGWSQVLDINRCPAYALPWLGQFVGVDLTKTPNLSYEQSVQKVLSRPGFSRGTVSALQSSLVAVINGSISGSVTPINPAQVLLLENTSPLGFPGNTTLFAAISGTGSTTMELMGVGASWFNAAANSSLVVQVGSEKILIPQGVYSFVNGPVSISIPSGNRGYAGTTATTHSAGTAVSVQSSPSMYQYNQYGITLLVPDSYFNAYTYNSLLVAAGGAGTTYTTMDSFIAGLGPTDQYNNLNSSPIPSASNSFANYIYSQRPAGVEVFVGCY